MQHMAREKLFYTLNLGQALLGTLLPLLALGTLQLFARRIPDRLRNRIYFSSALLILLGVLAMRWNVVIGGQLFSKSLRGVMTYKMEFTGMEGWIMGGLVLCLPFVILVVFVKLFLSEKLPVAQHAHPGPPESFPPGQPSAASAH
jgi:predicted membrane protein